MAQLIKLKRSSVAGKVPTTTQLDTGEIAINTADGKLYFERDDSTIQTIVTTNSNTTGSINIVGASSRLGINTTAPSYALDVNAANIRVGVHTIGIAGSAVTSSLAIGQDALGSYSGTSGNTAIGWKALSLVTGGPNDAIGAEAMRYSVGATYNIAIGAAAGYRSQGTQNTFIGQFSGPYYYDLTEGFNTFIGPLVGLFSSGSARQNTGIGASALYNLRTANSNTAIGSAAGFELTTGGFNTFLGDQAGRGVTTGARNTVIGRVAGLSSTLTKSIIIGDGDGTVRYRYDNTADNTFISSSLTTSGFISASGLIYAPNIGAGVDNSVVILDSDGTLRTDEIDSRVWGTSLVDGSGATNRVAYWSDTDTLTSDADFTFDGTSVGIGTGTPSEKLTVEGNISASGDLLLAHPNTPMVKLVDTTNDLQARFRVANSYAYLSVDNSNTVGSSRLVFQVDGDEAGYFDGNGLNVDGDLTVTGTVTAQEFHTEFVSASVIYQSGSTKFGDTADDVHQFTGSVNIQGVAHILAPSGDAVLIIEADPGNTVEQYNPRIELKQDGALVTTTIGINGTDNEAFTGAIANAFYINSVGSQQFAIGNTQILGVSTSGLSVTGRVIATSFTGSLLGTASVALSAPNLYSTDGLLTGNRTIDADGNDITFVVDTGNTFTIASDPAGTVAIDGLTPGTRSHLVGINTADGKLYTMTTSSIQNVVSASYAATAGVASSATNSATASYGAANFTTAGDVYINGNTEIYGYASVESLNLVAPNSDGFSTTMASASVVPNGSTVTMFTINSAGYEAAFLDYVVYDSARTNKRTGNFRINWDLTANAVTYDETSTKDIGDTAKFIMFAEVVGSVLYMKAENNTGQNMQIVYERKLLYVV